MAVLWVGAPELPPSWLLALRQNLPAAEIRIWPQIGNAEEIDVAVMLQATPGVLRSLPNLRLVTSMGLGVEHLVADPDLMVDVAIARAVDPGMLDQMRDFIVLNALRFRTRADAFDAAQRRRQWRRDIAFQPRPPQSIGLMGFGRTASRAASSLVALGFEVRAWTRRGRTNPDVEHYSGAEQLDAFLARSHMLVCALPLTDQTRGILGRRLFGALPRDAFLVNVGRGAHLVEDDLLEALATGQLSGASLDVFADEPLPTDHRFWDHPKVRITPHCAAVPNPKATMAHVAENIQRLAGSAPLMDLVDRTSGY